MTYKVSWLGTETLCYGDLNDTSNFQVVCDDEEEDTVWCDGVDNFTAANLTWDNVVMYLQPYFRSNILEISAV